MTITTDQQKKVAARIKALMAKTTAAGATEEEALSAMQKARELMDKYGLTMDAIKADAETIAKQAMTRDDFKTFVIKDYLANNVARYCDCKVWVNRKEATYTFFGTEQDRQFAIWLMGSLDLFVRNQTIRFMEERGHRGGKGPWALQKGFMVGCLDRIDRRLHALIRERNAKKAGNGRSLVVVKMQLVEHAFNQLDMRLRKGSRSGGMKGDGSAFSAGQAAGDRANFSRPVNGGAGMRAIAS
ncbi:uncharacterized protein DUF2786 [Pseudaminobacter salicylatoxidans]|uniref:Uncharacterized protein DUF2786 n=1 Tax=Pseudaminobacter salicylatoxidans TaxID=93369 RepID=A0A316C0S6_PSESE|nr:DUF2786 domain-containing protein [Pseudaminobacter salicylatoxidans]PWJ81509.1 uncharacterized protein DUF2786 [Pseudaminobacter salicylatoxidans]